MARAVHTPFVDGLRRFRHEFTPGALDLAAIATDEAGNESVPVVVPLVVEE